MKRQMKDLDRDQKQQQSTQQNRKNTPQRSGTLGEEGKERLNEKDNTGKSDRRL